MPILEQNSDRQRIFLPLFPTTGVQILDGNVSNDTAFYYKLRRLNFQTSKLAYAAKPPCCLRLNRTLNLHGIQCVRLQPRKYRDHHVTVIM